MAFPTGYTKYQNITIDNTKVSATLTDFPVFVNLANLSKAGTDIFDTCLSGGGDIRVTLSDGTTQLAREIVSIDTTAKTGEMHVKIPSLAGATDTVIRVWYNSTDTEPASDSTYGKEAVWNSNYKMVQHMNQDPSGASPQAVDSTVNHNNGSSVGSMTSSDLVDVQIGKGWEFDGTSQNMLIPDHTSLRPGTSSFTLQAWTEIPNISTNGVILATRYGSSPYTLILLFQGTPDVGNMNSSKKIGFMIIENFGAKMYAAYTTADVVDGNKHKIELVRNASDNPFLVIDGVSVGMTAERVVGSRPENVNIFEAWEVGVADGSFRLAFKADEVRIVFSSLSADWRTTEHNNQYGPGTFYTVSDEIDAGGGTAWTKDLSDTITMSDNYSDVAVFIRAFSDTITLSDTQSKIFGMVKSDTVTLSDDIFKNIGLVKSDTITMADDFNAIITLILSLNDTISMSDGIIKSFSLNKTDAVSMSDDFSNVTSFVRAFADTINLSDDLIKEISLALNDSVTMTDDFNAIITLLLSLSDTITMSDGIVKHVGLTQSDTINLTDNASMISEFFRTFSDNITMTDEIFKTFGLTEADIISMSDEFGTSTAAIYALLNFIAKNKTFNFIAKNKTFNFIAKSRGNN